MDNLSKTIERLMVPSYKKDGIFLITVDSVDTGLKIAKDVLCELVDKKTVLFLSGGQTPKPLYKQLAREGKLNAGSVALVDERYGEPLHKDSNEKMIKGTELMRYLSAKDIPFYPILQNADCHFDSPSGGEKSSSVTIVRGISHGVYTEFVECARDDSLALHLRGVKLNKGREQIAEEYDEVVRFLTLNFRKSVAILGIGSDGHTAGLPAGNSNFQFSIFKDRMVVSFDNFPGEFKERVTLTFNALSMIDALIVLAFGENKKEALEDMFVEGPVEEIPARFYLKPDIAQKTLLITDQKI